MRKVKLFKVALLLVTLGSLLLTACTSAQPKISFETDQIDLGEVEEGEVIEREVYLTNEGSAPLEIFSVSTSCGCTTASLDTKTISPGESVPLTIEFDSGAHDIEANVSVLRQIFISSNDPDQPEAVIDLTAQVLGESEN